MSLPIAFAVCRFTFPIKLNILSKNAATRSTFIEPVKVRRGNLFAVVTELLPPLLLALIGVVCLLPYAPGFCPRLSEIFDRLTELPTNALFESD
jgi:integral membrane sensor domain MASE1